MIKSHRLGNAYNSKDDTGFPRRLFPKEQNMITPGPLLWRQTSGKNKDTGEGRGPSRADQGPVTSQGTQIIIPLKIN